MSDEEVQLGFTPVSQVPNLQSATLLQDGRVAIAMVLLTPEPYFSSALKSPPAYWLVEAHILSKDPETGAWVMDEVFHVCGGDCEQYLELIGEREAYLLDPSGFEPATPEATPAN